MTRTTSGQSRVMLPPAADVGAGLRALSRALMVERPSERRHLRLEVPLRTPTLALSLPAGFPAGMLDPLVLAGEHWSGAGAAWQCDSQAPDLLPTPREAVGEDVRLAVSVRFDPAREADEVWSAFGRCRLWLPAVELDTGTQRLAVNLDVTDAAARARLLNALAAWRAPVLTIPRPLPVRWDDAVEARRTWDRQVSDALVQLRGGLGKVVLARRQRGVLAHAIDPASLLVARPLGEGGWPWWLARAGRHWLGETPERLGRRDGQRLQTLALAGTRRRGRTADEDDALGYELRASEKDRREQGAVAAWLRRRLAYATGGEVLEGKLELVKLPALQHLGQRLEATATGALRDRDWLGQLHPSPALCGSPRTAARAWLRATEDFDRGLYGGAIGWIEEDRAEVHVMIRGVQLAGEQVTTYAGCGLVLGSDARSEWQETEAKLAALCRRLGLSPPPTGSEA